MEDVGGSVAKISIGRVETSLHLSHTVFASRFCASTATTSVSALDPILKARSTVRASPRTSPVRLKIAAWPFAQSPHHLKPLERRICSSQHLESSHEPDQLLELAVIGLNDIIQIFDLPVYKLS